MDRLLGEWIGKAEPMRYQLKILLGKQSGRRTYLASDNQSRHQSGQETGKLVVIKLVLFDPDFAWSDLKLFEREAETLKALDHPAIPRYLDYFEVETPIGKGFALVQTYIELRSLQQQVTAGRTFSEDELMAISCKLLDILQYLHTRHPPVVHRDIKPSNILLTDAHSQQQQLYLIDFGSVQTAPTSGTMTIVGTYGYMPIEQFSGRALPASDLYSLGATLIYLATAKHPAELLQPNLQLDFEQYVQFRPSFTQWIKQLTCLDLSQRTPSAQEALNSLTSHQNYSVLSSLAAPITFAGDASSLHAQHHQLKDIELDVLGKTIAIQLNRSRVVESVPPGLWRWLLRFGDALSILFMIDSPALIWGILFFWFGLIRFSIWAWSTETLQNIRRVQGKTDIKISFPSKEEAFVGFGKTATSQGLNVQGAMSNVQFPLRSIKLGLGGRSIRFFLYDGIRVRIVTVYGSFKEISFLYKKLSRYIPGRVRWWDQCLFWMAAR